MFSHRSSDECVTIRPVPRPCQLRLRVIAPIAGVCWGVFAAALWAVREPAGVDNEEFYTGLVGSLVLIAGLMGLMRVPGRTWLEVRAPGHVHVCYRWGVLRWATPVKPGRAGRLCAVQRAGYWYIEGHRWISPHVLVSEFPELDVNLEEALTPFRTVDTA